jgi:hypothetical protein
VERNNSENLVGDGMIILQLILKKFEGEGRRLDSSGSRCDVLELQGSIKCGEFID